MGGLVLEPTLEQHRCQLHWPSYSHDRLQPLRKLPEAELKRTTGLETTATRAVPGEIVPYELVDGSHFPSELLRGVITNC